jgi:hypothetical protein
MPYNPTTWSLGDTITAALLNKLESGVNDAHAGDVDAGSVDTDALADAAVTAIKLAASAVSNQNVAPDAGIDASKVADGSVSNTEFQYLGGVTSDIQTQLDSKVSAGGAVPSGVITMWSGSVVSIPSGWLLCDGTNGTPDLRDRFIVGAGGTYTVNDTGGADSVQLSGSEMPSHSHGSGSLHTDSDGNHSHGGTAETAGSHGHSGSTDTAGAHTHRINSGDLNISGTQGPQTKTIDLRKALAIIHTRSTSTTLATTRTTSTFKAPAVTTTGWTATPAAAAGTPRTRTVRRISLSRTS